MLVFTNGCFDLIHAGHIDLLARAKALGTRLVVGLNSDKSVRTIKGPQRPVHDQDARRRVLMELRSVDDVVIFDELTPEALIKQLKPDILVKGGDWRPDEIVGGDFVRSYGGRVVSLPLLDGHSSSSILKKIDVSEAVKASTPDSPIDAALQEHIDLFRSVAESNVDAINSCADIIIRTFEGGKKVLVCGNGGSAADAQHLAAEFTGRYETDRQALPAIALTTDTSALTAIGNDMGFEQIFARQVDALAEEGDTLVAISTSGTSPNIIAAVMAARKRGCTVIGMTGSEGKKLTGLSDACIMIPSKRTARIQEAHITVAHIWCEIIDARFSVVRS